MNSKPYQSRKNQRHNQKRKEEREAAIFEAFQQRRKVRHDEIKHIQPQPPTDLELSEAGRACEKFLSLERSLQGISRVTKQSSSEIANAFASLQRGLEQAALIPLAPHLGSPVSSFRSAHAPNIDEYKAQGWADFQQDEHGKWWGFPPGPNSYLPVPIPSPDADNRSTRPMGGIAVLLSDLLSGI